MEIVTVGLNHHNAPVEIRAKLAPLAQQPQRAKRAAVWDHIGRLLNQSASLVIHLIIFDLLLVPLLYQLSLGSLLPFQVLCLDPDFRFQLSAAQVRQGHALKRHLCLAYVLLQNLDVTVKTQDLERVLSYTIAVAANCDHRCR